MNKHFLLLLFLLFTTVIFGQTKRGGWMIDGQFELKPFGGFPVFQLEVNPLVGYFLQDNFLVGTEVGFFYEQSKFVNTLKYIDYFSAPFARYYFLKGNFRPYTQVSYTFDWKRSPLLGYETKFYTAASVSIGINYFLNKNIALDAQFQFFLHDNREDRNRSQNQKFRGFRFGLNYFFNRQITLQKDTLAPLVNRFLKKGNFRIGLNTQFDFKEAGGGGTTNWEWFLLDNFKINNAFETVALRNVGIFESFIYLGYQPDFQLFIPINKSTFFSPSLGGDFGVVRTRTSITRIEVNGQSLKGRPTLTHFRNNAIIELGAEFRYHFHNRSQQGSKRWDADLFVIFTQFLNANLSVKAELNTNVVGLPKRSAIFDDIGRNAPEFLRLGFQYFIEKKK